MLITVSHRVLTREPEGLTSTAGTDTVSTAKQSDFAFPEVWSHTEQNRSGIHTESNSSFLGLRMQQSPLDTGVSLSALWVFLVSCNQGGPRLNDHYVRASDERKSAECRKCMRARSQHGLLRRSAMRRLGDGEVELSWARVRTKAINPFIIKM